MKGLLLRLKKLRQNVPNLGNLDLDSKVFLVFGYYDMLEIVEAVTWGDFSPGCNSTDFMAAEAFSHEVLVKLVEPPFACRLQNEHPDTIFFSQGCTDDEKFKHKPLLTIALLRYTKEKVSSQKKFYDLVEDTNLRIAQIIDNMNLSDADKPVFAVYPTIGFMDVAVICRSNGYATIANAIFELRSMPDLLSGCYMLPCAYIKEWKKKDAWDCLAKDDGALMSLGATLRPGLGSNHFFSVCKDELVGIDAYKDGIFFNTYGGSDVLSLPEKPLHSLISIFSPYENRLLHPPFKGLITSSHSSVRIRVPESALTDGSDDEAASTANLRFLEISFRKMLKDNNGGKDNIITSRLIEGLHDMACFYFDLTNSHHSFDIRVNMDPALETLIKIINKSKQVDSNIFLPAEFNENISIFRDAFTNLINDYARANKHMFEGRWLKHPAIASSNKLLLAYHLFLRNATKAYSQNSTYTFLTVSGGVDNVVADGLFPFLEPDNDGREDRLIILRLPEAALFTPSETLFHSFHEIFHFVGDRKRHLRGEHIFMSMAAYISDSFVRELWNPDSPPWIALRERLSAAGGSTKDLINNLEIKQPIVAEDFRKSVYDELCGLWRAALGKANQEEKFYRNWRASAFAVLNQTLVRYKAKIDDVFRRCLNDWYYKEAENLGIEFTRLFMYVENTYRKYYDERVAALCSDANDGIDCMLDFIGNAYQESFSDLCGILFLDSRKSDYLSGFNMRHWQQTDIKATESVFRIGGVLQACFPDDAYEASPTGNVEFNEQINRLFEHARMHTGIIKPLSAYLTECKDGFLQTLPNSDILDPIRTLYRGAQPGADYTVTDISPELLNILLQKWVDAAKEQANPA